MTLDQVSTAVSPFLKHITPIEGANLIRAEHIIDDSILGIYYLEYSNDNLSFDVDQFQENYISSDYYNHPGSLQWNYYLIFIRNEGAITNELKYEIEKDDIYTRKFVLSLPEIEEYFSYTITDQKVETDVVSLWKEKLRDVDLDEVYADTYYTEAIPRFLNNDVQKENVVDQNYPSSSEPIVNIHLISQITLLENYRPYPQPKRIFDFKRVNLIHGVNGSGKTSLLTSIELIIAGKSISDPDNPEPGNCISAIYNNEIDSLDYYTPNDNLKYRQRDNVWYSSSYQRGNELCRTFNRYNYFDSDAAYKLSFNEDNRQVSKYLSAIALGPDFGRIQDRIIGFEERLSKELREREKILNECNLRIEDAENSIKAISLSSDPSLLFSIFKNTVLNIGWKSNLTAPDSEEVTLYEKEYQDAFSLSVTLDQLLASSKFRLIFEAREALEKNNSAILKVETSVKDLAIAKEQVYTTSKHIEKLERALRTLNSAKIYFDNLDSFSILSIDAELADLNARIQRNQGIVSAFTTISNIDLLKSDEIIGVAKAEVQKSLVDATSKHHLLFVQKEKLKVAFDEIQNVVSEIKSLGLKYLTLNNSADACPLCNSPFSNAELHDRVNRHAQHLATNNTLILLTEESLLLEEQIKLYNDSLVEINKIEKIISMVYESEDYSKLTFSEIFTELMNIANSFEDDKLKRDNIETKKHILGQNGISISSFNTVKQAFEVCFTEVPFSPISFSKFQDLISENTIALSEARSLNVENIKKEAELSIKLEDIKRSISIPSTENDPVKYLEYSNAILTKILEQFNKLNQFLNASESEEFVDVKAKIEKMNGSFLNYRRSISEQKQIELANSVISSAQKEIDTLTPEISKIKKALTVLTEILTNDSEEIILGDFLKNNENEIQEIFQNLHTPKEFTSIEFNNIAKDLYLYKNGLDSPLTVNKISTGQRSALALSIFIALHKKLKKGPNVLLFDDPVTYTDDLNILSFLDYLRELVIKENRQLFFATANQKLAGLFEKKFAFLGDEFQSIPLERLT